MYELLDQHRMFEPKCLDDFKTLKEFLDRFEVIAALWHLLSFCFFVRLYMTLSFFSKQGLEKIAAYMKSNRFMKTPVNNKMAKWGNKKEWNLFWTTNMSHDRLQWKLIGGTTNNSIECSVGLVKKWFRMEMFCPYSAVLCLFYEVFRRQVLIFFYSLSKSKANFMFWPE